MEKTLFNGPITPLHFRFNLQFLFAVTTLCGIGTAIFANPFTQWLALALLGNAILEIPTICAALACYLGPLALFALFLCKWCGSVSTSSGNDQVR